MRIFRWRLQSPAILLTSMCQNSRMQSSRQQSLRIRFVLLLSILSLAGLNSGQRAPVWAASNELTAVDATFGREYAVPNGPRNIVEEAPGRMWYTSPDAGGIGFLEVTSAPDDEIVRYRT